MRHVLRRLAPVVSGMVIAWVLVWSGQVSAQSFKWWQSDKYKQDLMLTAEQSSRLEDIFQTAQPRLRQTKDELDKLEADLSRLIETNADEAQVGRQIDRVENLRSTLNKSRTLMLVHMRQVLTPDQRTRLNKLFEQWERDHPRPRSPGPR